ncbi:MAG: acyltransferase domain-containing protein, partial [Propionibacteriaceae bacterium]|nr:acyltransferase domain-containing protein [Propionibacteriaceae bacterium]
HLAATGQAARLVLVSRQGPAAPGAAALLEELADLGVDAVAEACDAADGAQLAQVLARIPPGQPLTGVVHAAGQVKDRLLHDLTADDWEAVLGPKAQAAWNLHRLTAQMDNVTTVYYSSAAALGAAGQGNYAGANALLDALATWRRQQGWPTTAIAWGWWQPASELTAAADTVRLRRLGLRPLAADQGLALFDQALAVPAPVVVAAAVDLAAAGTAGSQLPTLWRDLAPRAPEPAAAGPGPASLAARLAGVEPDQARRIITDLVLRHTAEVAPQSAPAADQTFQDLGLQSLGAVELRNRLSAETGLRLPSTLVFDHPTPAAVAARILDEIRPAAAAGRPARDRPLASSAAAASEAIAIVGLSGRFPGAASPEALWQLLSEGADAFGPAPVERGWQGDYQGGFLDAMAGFDAGFFGISEGEALVMDPLQRLFLEASWLALEDARLKASDLKGSATGVFAGVLASRYAEGADTKQPAVAAYGVTGQDTSAVAGRVSYCLGLEGPAVSVNTACSSSLVALHLACQSLRSGESDLALAGGVTVLVTADAYELFDRMGGVAADGRCKPFSDQADGTTWGEGVGVVVLERLSDARRLGHRAHALILGTAVNQDGASNGLSAPNGPAQEKVIRQALANAQVSPDAVSLVEAHGTGTALGDPIEIQALSRVYGRNRPTGQPLWLGSVKSNFGHTGAAAGVAGLLKLVQAIKHELMPPTLRCQPYSSAVDWAAAGVAPLAQARPWPRSQSPRLAGLSSFGVSGTNAHVILAEAPAPEPATPPTGGQAAPAAGGPEHAAPAGGATAGPAGLTGPGARLWLVSGSDEAALGRQAAQLAAWARRHDQDDPDAVGWSLAATRTWLPARAALTAPDRPQLIAGLDALAAGRRWPEPHDAWRLAVGGARRQAPRIVFVFPGQGAQWLGMGRELMAADAAFAQAIDRCDRAVAEVAGWSLADVLAGRPDAVSLDRVDVVQPALFAVMVGLVELWRTAGVRPDAVVGHSQGEIAAAVAAGGLSIEEGARVVAIRAQALTRLAGRGAMASLDLPAAGDIDGWLSEAGPGISLAAVNSPSQVVVSGPPEAVDRLLADCQGRGWRGRRINVDYASHSPDVESVRQTLAAGLGQVAAVSGRTPFYSTVEGGWADTASLDAGYWYRNLRQPVGFAPALRRLAEEGYDVFVEISPHPVLTPALQETVEAVAPEAVVTPTLRRDQGERESFLAAVGRLAVADCPVDWAAVYGPAAGSAVDLPGYDFHHTTYWLPPRRPAAGPTAGRLGLAETGHPILSGVLTLADDPGVVLTGTVSLAQCPWLADHQVDEVLVAPGAFMVDLAWQAGAARGLGRIEELVLQAPLLLDADGETRLQVRLTADGEVSVYSQAAAPGAGEPSPGADAAWTCHAVGRLAPAANTLRPAGAEPEQAWPPPGAQPVDLTGFYEGLTDRGYVYGPAFQGLRQAWRLGSQVFAEVAVPAVEPGFRCPPPLLDACLHSALLSADASDWSETYLPFAFSGAEAADDMAAAPPERWRVTARLAPDKSVHLRLADEHGQTSAVIEQIALRPVDRAQWRRQAGWDNLYRLAWRPPPSPDPAAGGAPLPADDDGAQAVDWAVLGSAALAEALTAAAPNGREALVAVCPDAAALDQVVSQAAGPPRRILVDVSHLAQTTAPSAPDADLAADADWPAEARRLALAATAILQRCWSDPRLAETEVVWLTDHAVAVDAVDQILHPAQAVLWGLVRSAQTEQPGRFSLIDAGPADWPEAGRALDGRHEPQQAVRHGRSLVPRLVKADAPAAGRPPVFAPGGVVVMTGGAGLLGGLLARHLATVHRVGRLVVVSRQGAAAPGADQLRADLADSGVEVDFAACDAADLAQLAEVFDRLPPDQALTGVVHVAGVLSDRLIPDLTAADWEAVLAPKTAAAWNLHLLTRHLPAVTTVYYSSAAAVLGSPGQGDYAGANAVLDALAVWRDAHGWPTRAIAWGWWEETSQLTQAVDEARLTRFGLKPLASDEGLGLFDQAVAGEAAATVAARFDLTRLRAAGPTELPPIWHALAPHRPTAADPAAALARRLAGLDRAAALDALTELVLKHTAEVAPGVQPEEDQTFKDLGLPSLAAVELRNRLNLATGVKLPATLVFDAPTPRAVAERILGSLRPRPADEATRPAAALAANSAESMAEPIAVVGLACRFPGSADGLEGFWNLLGGAVDAIGPAPAERGWAGAYQGG